MRPRWILLALAALFVVGLARAQSYSPPTTEEARIGAEWARYQWLVANALSSSAADCIGRWGLTPDDCARQAAQNAHRIAVEAIKHEEALLMRSTSVTLEK